MRWPRGIFARLKIPNPWDPRNPRPHLQVPPPVADYLLPDEKHVITVRRHPVLLVSHIALLACACAAASLLSAVTDSGAPVLGAAWGACAALFLCLIARVAQWLSAYFVATDTRLIFITGIFVRKVVTVPVREISDLEFRRSLIARLIGYGTFIARPKRPGYRMPTMNYMPYPEQVFRDVTDLIFSGESEN